jgi:hypothetical protein
MDRALFVLVRYSAVHFSRDDVPGGGILPSPYDRSRHWAARFGLLRGGMEMSEIQERKCKFYNLVTVSVLTERDGRVPSGCGVKVCGLLVARLIDVVAYAAR